MLPVKWIISRKKWFHGIQWWLLFFGHHCILQVTNICYIDMCSTFVSRFELFFTIFREEEVEEVRQTLLKAKKALNSSICLKKQKKLKNIRNEKKRQNSPGFLENEKIFIRKRNKMKQKSKEQQALKKQLKGLSRKIQRSGKVTPKMETKMKSLLSKASIVWVPKRKKLF